MNIKAFTAAALLATAATTVSAGGLMDEIVETPVQEPVVVEDDGLSNYLIPLAIVAVLIAVAAGDSGGGS